MSSGTRRGARQRIDRLLVERGLVGSREKAQAVILAGLVSAGGRRIDKPGSLIRHDEAISLRSGPRFVSRGGEKLDGALETLGFDVRGIAALDVGSSTGGFTDCLIQRGAARVVAVDVGRGQLDWKLRNDPRVSVLEGINVRYLEPEAVPAPFDLIVVDVSFISLRLVLPPLVPLLGRSFEPPPGAAAGPAPSILALVKPQFEAGRGAVGRGGIVRDAGKQLETVLEVTRFARSLSSGPGDGSSSRASGDGERLDACRILESSIQGAEGNREFFVHLVPGYSRDWSEIEAEARRVVLDEASG